MPKLRNVTTGEIIAENVRIADGWWERFAGPVTRLTAKVVQGTITICVPDKPATDTATGSAL